MASASHANELGDIAEQYKNWLTNRSQKWGAPILEPPSGRRDDFIDPYFKPAKPDQIVAIVRAREPWRLLIANGNQKDDRWHLQIAGPRTNAREDSSRSRGKFAPN